MEQSRRQAGLEPLRAGLRPEHAKTRVTTDLQICQLNNYVAAKFAGYLQQSIVMTTGNSLQAKVQMPGTRLTLFPPSPLFCGTKRVLWMDMSVRRFRKAWPLAELLE